MKIDNNRTLLGSCQIGALSSSQNTLEGEEKLVFEARGWGHSHCRRPCVAYAPIINPAQVIRPDAQLDSSASGVMGPDSRTKSLWSPCTVFSCRKRRPASKLYRRLIRRLMVLCAIGGFFTECYGNKATNIYLTVISEGTVALMSLDMRVKRANCRSEIRRRQEQQSSSSDEAVQALLVVPLIIGSLINCLSLPPPPHPTFPPKLRPSS